MTGLMPPNSPQRSLHALSHRFRPVPLLFAALLLGAIWGSAAAAEPGDDQAATTREATAEEIERVIADLEDPEARARVIATLRLLQQAQTGDETPAAEEDSPAKAVQTATSDLLRTLSQRMATFGQRTVQLGDAVNELPAAWSWLQAQASNPKSRETWSAVLLNLALTLGLGYAALYLLRLALRRPRRVIAGKDPGGSLARVGLLLALLLVDLLPIGAFGVAAYLTLGLMDPHHLTRVVALAWINASIIVRLVQAVGRVALAPAAPGLRLPPISDESAHYGHIWITRLAFTSIYGYIALQAALLLGMPATVYEALLHLLGLFVAGLVLVLVMQNRENLAEVIRGQDAEARGPLARVRRRLAGIWHLLAVPYVLLVYGIWALDLPGGFTFIVKGTVITLLVFALGHLALRLLARVFERGLRISEELRGQFPGLEPRANRYLPVLHGAMRWMIYLLAAIALLQAWGLNAFGWLTSEPTRVLGGTLFRVLLILGASIGIWEVSNTFVQTYLEAKDGNGEVKLRSPRIRTLMTVARNALLATLSVVATLLILSELGINIAPLLAGAGVVGLAVGFGAQTLVKDIITGVFIIFQDLIAVGEVVKVGDTAGLVEAVSIRNVRLRDLSGTVHTIPFSAITTISNLTKDFSYAVFDIAIAYREDVDEVMEVLGQIGSELRADPEFAHLILAPLEVLGLDKFADSAVIIKARIKTLPIQQWGVGREFNRRMKRRFDELGIEIPFPHQTVYFGEDKAGEAPAARVMLGSALAAQPSPLDLLAGSAGPKPSGGGSG